MKMIYSEYVAQHVTEVHPPSHYVCALCSLGLQIVDLEQHWRDYHAPTGLRQMLSEKYGIGRLCLQINPNGYLFFRYGDESWVAPTYVRIIWELEQSIGRIPEPDRTRLMDALCSLHQLEDIKCTKIMSSNT